MNFLELQENNVLLLNSFINDLGPAADSFRYYNSRSTSIIKNHLVTLLMMEENKPVAYGHLDPENDIIWLGICVLPGYQHKGYGKLMMTELLDKARQLALNSISLTVDKDNTNAIRLYEQFKFSKEKEADTHCRYRLDLSK